jgi:hypothetical protein
MKNIKGIKWYCRCILLVVQIIRNILVRIADFRAQMLKQRPFQNEADKLTTISGIMKNL